MENVNKIVDLRCKGLENSKKTFQDIYNVMFSTPSYILAEWNDGYKIYTKSYKEADILIKNTAYSINMLYKDLKDEYIGIAIESSFNWLIAFWAILASGNKPYLINLRHPKGLVNNLLNSLGVKYLLAKEDLGYQGNLIYLDDLNLECKDNYEFSFGNEMVLSTSATTLKEKLIFYNGVEISNQILNARAILKENKQIKIHYHNRLKQLVFLPLYHIFGFMATYMWFSFFGRTMVFLNDYSKETILRTIRKHEVTHVFAVPLFWHSIEKEIIKSVKQKQKEKKFNKGINLCLKLQGLFKNKGLNMSKRIMHEVTDELFGKSVVFCISGGSYIKDSTLKLINALGYPLYNGYGMSEIGITSVELGYKKDRLKNSIGKPMASIKYEIKDDILYVSGSSISHKMKIDGEYIYNNDEYKTSDLARVDKTGRYYILGRSDDLFIGPNGENISPDTLEQEFNIEKANRFSILNINNKLSMVVEISKYLPKTEIENLYKYITSVNDKLDSSLRVNQIYFTYDPIQAETQIKVSRQYLLMKLQNKEVNLLKIEDIVNKENNDTCNQEILNKVLSIMEDILQTEKIDPYKNFFYDLEGTSLDYFSLISSLNKEFDITITFNENKNYHTAYDLALLIEEILSL